MFPSPIDRASPPKRYLYYAAVVVALIVWLLPLLAVLLTSIRSAEDMNMGNYWGWPKEWRFSNYIEIFQATPLAALLDKFGGDHDSGGCLRHCPGYPRRICLGKV